MRYIYELFDRRSHLKFLDGSLVSQFVYSISDSISSTLIYEDTGLEASSSNSERFTMNPSQEKLVMYKKVRRVE